MISVEEYAKRRWLKFRTRKGTADLREIIAEVKLAESKSTFYRTKKEKDFDVLQRVTQVIESKLQRSAP